MDQEAFVVSNLRDKRTSTRHRHRRRWRQAATGDRKAETKGWLQQSLNIKKL
jgi:hypothetical protein